MTDAALGRFDSRYAMRHVRTYLHPIDRVWEAVTTAEHLDAWMLPRWTVDLRLGGRCTATFGDTSEPPGFEADETITELEPPNLVNYNGLRFALEALDDTTTRLTFVQSMPPEASGGEDQWIPDFCAGFHAMLDRIPDFLDGRWTLADNLAELAKMPAGSDEYRDLIERYRDEVFTLRPAR